VNSLLEKKTKEMEKTAKNQLFFALFFSLLISILF